ncbi:hypothetical protein HBJ58_09925 [Halomonas desiderata]|uniref:Uncharacterized protein n=1 Tax=Billgrantia desiderata TaxID=52021 RepID=A0AAW4Z085_9GAMM|nr:hypothetical protein [Halomonas desiderata]MCE8010749.1 hypothetical protein [Halomonas desiderata]MCE8042087.1 hypothetical protein [Halomonas desiderata]MCE8046768.1 hypothetical protein [Halomonas desiderata]MCE8053371.1 hypothetical protein [Halomonas desiderata]NIC36998.1 hypothetical protein [Halomonas desiderata]
MPFSEAKEHAPGHLHHIFADPYSAFDNLNVERQLHLRVALQTLVCEPMTDGTLTLRVIHGWENGGFEPADLAHSDHRLATLEDLEQVRASYQQAMESAAPLPRDDASLLAAPLADAIAAAEAKGQALDEETRTIPARWPTFDQGLSLYTFFKVYHRLTYGEDDSYRSIRCQTPQGPHEIHEFHLEEGEFAVIRPVEDATGNSVLVLHDSQLEPVLMLLEACRT